MNNSIAILKSELPEKEKYNLFYVGVSFSGKDSYESYFSEIVTKLREVSTVNP